MARIALILLILAAAASLYFLVVAPPSQLDPDSQGGYGDTDGSSGTAGDGSGEAMTASGRGPARRIAVLGDGSSPTNRRLAGEDVRSFWIRMKGGDSLLDGEYLLDKIADVMDVRFGTQEAWDTMKGMRFRVPRHEGRVMVAELEGQMMEHGFEFHIEASRFVIRRVEGLPEDWKPPHEHEEGHGAPPAEHHHPK